MLNAIFVILGAALWATDTIFRHPMTHQITPLSIVFLEHSFALMIASLWVFVFEKKKLELAIGPLFGAALIGILGSALATILFTMSFQFVNPSVSILLQKTQPIAVVLLSWLFLGEKLTLRFFTWGTLALVSAFYLSFPHGLTGVDLEEANITGALLALGASLLWAISTIIGKATLKKMSGSHLTLWRFFFGFLTLWTLLYFVPQSRIEIPFVTNDSKIMLSIFFMALVPGFLGVTLYYRGLTRLKASTATILELAFPLCAVFVNSKFLDLHLENIQLLAAAILVFCIIKISYSSTSNN